VLTLLVISWWFVANLTLQHQTANSLSLLPCAIQCCVIWPYLAIRDGSLSAHSQNREHCLSSLSGTHDLLRMATICRNMLGLKIDLEHRVEPQFTNLIRSWRPFVARNVHKPKLFYIIYLKKTTKHNEIQEKAQWIRAGMCTERKLHSNWRSPADTPSLSLTVVAGLRVCYSRHCSSPETFFVWKICSWTDLLVMRGVREPRYHCINKKIHYFLEHLLVFLQTVLQNSVSATQSHHKFLKLMSQAIMRCMWFWHECELSQTPSAEVPTLTHSLHATNYIQHQRTDSNIHDLKLTTVGEEQHCLPWQSTCLRKNKN
jgi:hypothetical protein